MRWRPFGFLLVAVLLTSGCGSGGGATSARYQCFRFHLDRAPLDAHSVLAVDVVATNITASSCAGRSCGGVTGRFVITNTDGREVEHEGGAGVTCQSNAPPPEQVRPGASVVWGELQWDGLGDLTGRCKNGDCNPTRPRMKPGLYRVRWTWIDAVDIRSGWMQTRGTS